MQSTPAHITTGGGQTPNWLVLPIVVPAGGMFVLFAFVWWVWPAYIRMRARRSAAERLLAALGAGLTAANKQLAEQQQASKLRSAAAAAAAGGGGAVAAAAGAARPLRMPAQRAAAPFRLFRYDIFLSSYCREDSAAVDDIEEKLWESNMRVFRALRGSHVAGAEVVDVELLSCMIKRCVPGLGASLRAFRLRCAPPCVVEPTAC
jgi:hypothetical protein